MLLDGRSEGAVIYNDVVVLVPAKFKLLRTSGTSSNVTQSSQTTNIMSTKLGHFIHTLLGMSHAILDGNNDWNLDRNQPCVKGDDG